LGDLFFFEMFPAVYTQGGGEISVQLVRSLDKILVDYPADTKVIPGHGNLAVPYELITRIVVFQMSRRAERAEGKRGLR
jgi:glyoxylase-like metal-dependent hydrolase (beta-lactamase superfamily II)